MVAAAAILVLAGLPAFAQTAVDSVFGVRYVSNFSGANANDTIINVTNTGESQGLFRLVYTPGVNGGTTQVTENGNICVNLYVYDPNEELLACCSCPLTPNATGSWSFQKDILPFLSAVVPPTSVTIKLLATAQPNDGVTDSGGKKQGKCDPSAGEIGILGSAGFVPGFNPNVPAVGWDSATNLILSEGMAAWARGNGTETAFFYTTLSAAEKYRLSIQCANDVVTVSNPFCNICAIGAR